MPDVQIYPPQLNHVHNLFTSGDPDLLLKAGRWSIDLGRQWIKEADFILIEPQRIVDWEKETLRSGEYEKLGLTPPLGTCEVATQIYIYRKKP